MIVEVNKTYRINYHGKIRTVKVEKVQPTYFTGFELETSRYKSFHNTETALLGENK